MRPPRPPLTSIKHNFNVPLTVHHLDISEFCIVQNLELNQERNISYFMHTYY